MQAAWVFPSLLDGARCQLRVLEFLSLRPTVVGSPMGMEVHLLILRVQEQQMDSCERTQFICSM